MHTRATGIRVIGSAFRLGALAVFAVGCSLGDGFGEVESEQLFARECWNDPYDLRPDFFAAVPFRDSVHIRVQRGTDFVEVSDGLSVLVNDVSDIRKNKLNQPVPVTLPPGVTPPGFPVAGFPEGSDCDACGHPVHLSLYLLKSCHTANSVLYGLSGSVTFEHLFSGDPNESNAAEKLTKASFDVMIGDPQDMVTSGPDKGTVPDQSHLTGSFEFFFQRGQPAQPFP